MPDRGKPTDPDAPFIFMTGPLAGTPAPSSSNWVTICLHYSIPYAAGVGHGHGFWAAYLKHAGYEGIIFTGKASKPVYLWIDDAQVELRDASGVWGQGTRETERLIKRELDDDEHISVACIGTAGEALLPGASVKADRNHGAGKGSPGAIMGSKLLKAVAVRGTGKVALARPEALVDTAVEWENNILQKDPEKSVLNQAPAVSLKDGGISNAYGIRLGKRFRVAGKNMTDPEWGDGFATRFVEGCARWRIVPKPSYNCEIGCAYDVHISDGPFSGMVVSTCGGGEQHEGAAAMIGVTEADAGLIMVDLYDDIGVESGTFGSIIGMAFEAYNKGYLTKDDTDGLELTWGNWQAAMDLIDMMIKHEGFGGKLAAGLKEAPAALGREKGLVDEFSRITLHVKGAGINLHDWRPFMSAIFGFVMAGTGPSHQGWGVDWIPEPQLGYGSIMPGVVDTQEEALKKVDAVRQTQFAKIFCDSLGICMFASLGVKDSMRLSSRALAQAVGWDDYTSHEGLLCGERITNLMRVVYARRGFKKSDEFDISHRYLEPAPAGPSKGKTLAPFLPAMVDEYYRQMGWDVETGLPLPETLQRLGIIEEFAETT
jgi:aldehyde:ferredoxin oxidoreductase